ncbi:putative generative cell specific-1, HAP2-GCS1 [Rosa chinensis]|uniref:Putative generative cell specific-1, HAP2-GCS1 n=1 Tax=Rosa chinensis TaxID=74649 RepID=A0A2P6P7A7_ROSCH|nr:putative generative cell specific-1, HAP2-GCS1 [Rosa chinensis]
MRIPPPKLWLTILLFLPCFISDVVGVQILSKSKLDKCEKTSDSSDLNCTKKIVLNMAVPSGASGGEASIVAEIVEVEENSSNKMQTFRIPPVLTVNKSAAYALYQLTYIRDVAYKPEEYYVKTRKCEPDADAKVVKIFDKLMKGKPNTAHCVRFPGDWFHVFGIGQRSVGFSVLIQVKTGSKVSKVLVGPENRTAISNDKFLRANLIGDFVGYTNIPSFEDFYLVIPRQGGPGQPQNLGRNFSMWMLLERVRFTLDGVECNKIGVNFEAFNRQPNFCSSPFWSCLHNQLWNFLEADQNRIERKQVPLFGVEGRFERINEHPNAGTHSFSIGVTEVINTNLLIELSADDVDYVYQRSPGKILSINIPTFEALTQFGTATITAKNTGEVEASYCLTGNPFKPPKAGTTGFFDSIESFWNHVWETFIDFITGKSCRTKCSGFFDFRCHIQYICMSWILMFGLLLAIFPTVIVLLWLLHQKGLFDPLYDWWDDHFWEDSPSTKNTRHRINVDHRHVHVHKHHGHEARHHNYGTHHKRKSTHNDHKHSHYQRSSDYHYDLHHVHKDKHKHGRRRSSSVMQKVDENTGYRGQKKQRRTTKDYSK